MLKRPAGSYLIVSHGGLLDQLMHAIVGVAHHADPSGVRFRLIAHRFRARRIFRIIIAGRLTRSTIMPISILWAMQSLKREAAVTLKMRPRGHINAKMKILRVRRGSHRLVRGQEHRAGRSPTRLLSNARTR
ncbi:MAG: hypothetical protein U0V48_11370 [Anaerolineales bacterium]